MVFSHRQGGENVLLCFGDEIRRGARPEYLGPAGFCADFGQSQRDDAGACRDLRRCRNDDAGWLARVLRPEQIDKDFSRNPQFAVGSGRPCPGGHVPAQECWFSGGCMWPAAVSFSEPQPWIIRQAPVIVSSSMNVGLRAVIA